MADVAVLVWERWMTVQDERVCSQCGPLHGRLFAHGVGPMPPLHPGCRCQRVHAADRVVLPPPPLPPVDEMPEPLPPLPPFVPLPLLPPVDDDDDEDEDEDDWLPPVVRG